MGIKETDSKTTTVSTEPTTIPEKKIDPFDELLNDLNNDDTKIVENLFSNLREYFDQVKIFIGTTEGAEALE
jgi:hypothetical protein